jgi:hypothetical protein
VTATAGIRKSPANNFGHFSVNATNGDRRFHVSLCNASEIERSARSAQVELISRGANCSPIFHAIIKIHKNFAHIASML